MSYVIRVKWKEDLAHEQANLRTIQLHKFSHLQQLDLIPPDAINALSGVGPAMEVLMDRGYVLRFFTIGDLCVELWRCRLADVKWAYGEAKELALERAVKIWVWAYRPTWER